MAPSRGKNGGVRKDMHVINVSEGSLVALTKLDSVVKFLLY